jgi:hypothetical protein
MKYNQKIILLSALILIIIIGIFLDIKQKTNPKTAEILPENTENKIEKYCFYKHTQNQNGFFDNALLLFEKNSNQINGEFRNLPGETDSMVGNFEGQTTQSFSDNETIVSTVWNSYAEGMYDKRELNFSYTEENAFVDFAGNTILKKIDCNDLEEKLEIEEYIRKNIENIATNEEVLGGTWYVTTVSVNPKTKTGEVSYEDGHIASNANFMYEYNKENNIINIINFKETNELE